MIRLSTAAMVARTLSRESELRGLAQLVGHGDVCLDIGAAYGMYTFPLARLVGRRGQVHSFEPLRVPYRILERARRAAGAGQVIATNAALGPRNGRQRLRLPYRFGLLPNHGWAHLLTDVKRPDESGGRTMEVPVYSIDHICETRRIPWVNFMKVDVEGFESAVLEGGLRTIERQRPALLLEIEDRHLDKYGLAADDVVEPLLGMGYRMHIWWRGRWQRTHEVAHRRRNYLFSTRHL
ncbi:FkbM family methyltransferase [Nonomuraea antimicrobica]|uniref:FkbM family methyltransferase n=1 Tax=Nonomuraea antimicrobica TaxID=561173 RepID=A0ABP7E3C4_9ACTN